MLDLRFDGAVGTLLEGMGAGLNHLEVVQTDAGPMVISVSGSDGGVICIGFDSAGRPQLLEQRFFEDTIENAVDGRLAIVQVGSEMVVLVGAANGDALVGYQMTDAGLGARVDLQGTQAAGARDTQTIQTDNGFIFSAASDGGLRCFQSNQDGRLNAGDVLWDTDSTFHATPTALESVSVDGQSYLLSLCTDGTGVSVFAVNDTNGRLTATSAMGTELGLGLYETPNDLATAQIGGKTFVIVASRGETTQGAALSVMELAENGQLVVTDHILDNLMTRFGTVSGISVVEHNGFQYVLAAGGDQGVDLFTLLPNGTLVHLDTITSELGASLDSLTDVAAVVVGDQLNLLATSHQRDEVTALSADLSAQGAVVQASAGGGQTNGTARNDILMGSAGDDQLNGGAGNDILYDGAGVDALTGGQGADRFVMAFDGARDTITDFNPAQDTLDLSHVPMLYSMGQITVTSFSWGVRLFFRAQELDLRSTNPMGIEDIERAIDWTVDRPPLVLQVEVRGSGAADTLEGSDGNDLIYGEAGDDLIYGGEGADQIDGGARDDTIFAGAGDDTVQGGDGRDEVHLEAGNDVYTEVTSRDGQQFDLVFGGDGDDTITSVEGGDELHGGAGNDSLTGGRNDNRIYGGTSFDTIRAGDGNDSVWGGDGRDLAFLGTGDDMFFDNGQGGAFGRDTVFAGTGDDTIQGGNGADTFFGDAGNDVIYARLGDDSIYAGDGDDSVFGGDGRDLAYLGAGNDIFYDTGEGGTQGRDTVYAGGGNDTIEGGNGDDVFYGQEGNDLILARLGNDTVYGGEGFDVIDAGAGNDVVFAGEGRDRVFLGQGDDRYVDTPQSGELGQDTINGGAGADTFVFGPDMSHDVITDFQTDLDTLSLDRALTEGRSGWGVVFDLARITDEGVLIEFGDGQSLLLENLTSMSGLAGDIDIFSSG